MKNDIVWDTDYALFLTEAETFFSLFDLLDAEVLSKTFSRIIRDHPSGLQAAQDLLLCGWTLFDSMLMLPTWSHVEFVELLPLSDKKGVDDLLHIHLSVAARLRDRLSYSRSLPVLPKSDECEVKGFLARAVLSREAYSAKLRQLVDLDCDKIVRVFRSIHELRGGVEQDTVDGWLRDAGY